MSNNKEQINELIKIAKGNLAYGDSVGALIIVAYQELKKRGEILDEYNISLNNNLTNKEIIRKLENVFRKISSEDIRNFILSIINEIIKKNGNNKEIDCCPLNISQIIFKLLSLNNGDSLLDLGSGLGLFLADAHNYSLKNNFSFNKLFGLEINNENVELSKILLNILGIKNFEIINANAFDNFDFIYNKAFCFPPIGLCFSKLNIKSNLFNHLEKFTNRNCIEWVFIDKMLSKLQGKNSKAIAIVSPRALFSTEDFNYRKALLENGKIESIIELPNGAFPSFASRLFIISFSNNNNGVKIVDASGIIKDNTRRFVNTILPLDTIFDLYNSAPIISNNELINKNSLIPSDLLLKNKIKIYPGSRLETLSDIIVGTPYTSKEFEKMFSNSETGYKILTSSDINDGIIDWNNLKKVDIKNNKFDKYSIHKGDLIMSTRSSKVKTTVVDIEPKDKIIVTGGMIIVRPHLNMLNPTYLKVYLESENGSLVLQSIQRGNVIKTISSNELKEIIVPELNIDEQRKIEYKFNSYQTALLALKKEISAIEEKRSNLFLNEYGDR